MARYPLSLICLLFITLIVRTQAMDPTTTEAMPTDAMTTEAMATDAMTTDAGTTDAMTTDAVTTDAMTTDGGMTTDAGTTEAMTTEAPTDAPAPAVRPVAVQPIGTFPTLEENLAPVSLIDAFFEQFPNPALPGVGATEINAVTVTVLAVTFIGMAAFIFFPGFFFPVNSISSRVYDTFSDYLPSVDTLLDIKEGLQNAFHRNYYQHKYYFQPEQSYYKPYYNKHYNHYYYDDYESNHIGYY